MKKTATTMTALALVASLATAQDKPAANATAKPAAPATTTQSADPIIMSAGTISIRQSEFEAALKSLPTEYQQFATGPGKRQFAEDFLRMKMLASEGMKAGLDKDPEVVNQINLIRENLVAQAQLNRIEKGIAIPDEDLKKVYDANAKDYEQATARHILIAFKGSPAAQPGKPELTEDQAKAKAEDLRKQLVAGANFEELAKKESDDVGSGSRGGDLGSFGRGQMVPEFEKAAFDSKVGEISQVIRTQYGYHIVKVEKREQTPFAQVKAALERTQRQERLQERLDAMKTAAKPTFSDTYFTVPAAPTAEQPVSTPASNPKQ